MNSQKRNDVTIYNLSSGPTLPEWLGERARRNLSKRDEQVRRRIELLQDFQMPSSSSKVIQSGDGRYIITAGTYPPRFRCYDVHELTLKFERYVDSHIQDVVMLGEDYGKLALLLDDRTIAFHAHYGAHDKIRIPKFGRGLAYEPTTCDLLVAANGNEVYRINLDEGRFLEPWLLEKGGNNNSSSKSVAASCISVAPSHPLAAVGCDDGIVRFFDQRSDSTQNFLKLDVTSAMEGYGSFIDDKTRYGSHPNEITAVAHDTSGLYMAAGTAGGLVALYDVRSSRPLHVKEHKHGMPIHTIKFHAGSGSIFSADEKLIKIWKYKSTGDRNETSWQDSDMGGSSHGNSTSSSSSSSVGALVSNVEASSKFTHFLVAGDEADPTGSNSGLLLCATDEPKLESFYMPKVGLAPKWCSFLENITEELEERDLKRDGDTRGASDLVVREGEESIFENYKFVSQDDLEKFGISHLIGTPLLRGYMHGFFMDINLYNRVRAVANPFEYEDYRKKKLKDRLDAKRASRIAPKDSARKKASKGVNPELAERLMDKAEDGAGTKAGKFASKILADDRFGVLFSNPDYQIDEDDINFKLRNPSGVAASKGRKSNRRDDMDSDDDNSGSDDDDDGSKSVPDEEGTGFQRVGIEEEDQNADSDDDDHDDDSDSDEDGIRGGKVSARFRAETRICTTLLTT
jgi:ribosome biogenesis protein ENP2